MLRYYLILLLIYFIQAQHINYETGWEFHSSPFQSFYIFDNIQIDGQSAQGDGWAPSTTLSSVCVDNPNSCDVLGAFLDDVCVGWVYADSEGFTTLPIMGTSLVNPPTNTENYCLEGDIPTIKIYDSVNGTILDVTTGDEIPEWSENIVYNIENISFANNGIINSSTGWSYFQSSNQAFYVFENIIIDTTQSDELDVLGAFKNDLCVGWINYDLDGFTSIPVMGIEADLYPDYMIDGEVPDFKLFDYSEGIYYNVVPSETIPGWSSNGYFIIYGNSTTIPEAVEGCTDSSACNYNEEFVIDDDSCQYGNECNSCSDAPNQLECMTIDGCMWMGDHCMESNDNCMELDNEFDCMNSDGCYWMGDHCMTGSNCTDPIAFNYNPIADLLGDGDDSTCQYSSFLNFGCTYVDAINFNSSANVDDGSCEYEFADINGDGIINVLDIVQLVNIVLE